MHSFAIWVRRLHFRSTLCQLGLGIWLATYTASAATEVFIARDGDDSFAGTRSRPFAHLEGARDAIRGLKKQGSLPRGGIVVRIQGGTYLRTNSFELSALDSGTPDAPVEYRAAEGEPVRLIGGRGLLEWHSVTDAGVLARLQPDVAAYLWQADVRALGLKNLGSLHSRGFGRPVVPSHPESFYQGQPMTLARWPNEAAWERIAGFPERSAQGDEHGGHIGDLAGGFYYTSDRPSHWRTVQNVWVHGYWAWDWANSYEEVASIDLAKHWIKTAPPHGLYGFRKGQRFYFVNVLEELDQPGEWYLDNETDQLFFWPPDEGAGSASALEASPKGKGAAVPGKLAGEAFLSTLETPLVSFDGVSNVTLRGLSFEVTRGHAIRIQGGTNDLIAGCLIRNVGNYGVWIEGGHGHGVVSCDIENTGDGGVNLSGGSRETLEPGNSRVENCHFQKQGRWSKCYVPAVLLSGVGNNVLHNLIHDHPHCAVLFTGNDHRIEFNEIHHVALETGDVGAVYAGRDWSYRGNAIRSNFIHDTGGVGMGSMGVYMDDCVSGTEISGNIFYHVTRAAFLGGGRDHRVENNIFVDCDPAVQLDGRGMDLSPVWHSMVYDFMQKQLGLVPFELYRARYPSITNLDHYYQSSTNGIPPEGNVVARNICVGGQWLSVGWHAKEQMLNLHDNYVGADPGFVAPAALDFRLREKNQLPPLGFNQIPQGNIGLVNDRDRGTLKVVRSQL